MMDESQTHLPLRKALVWILLSTLVVTGSALMGTSYYWHVKALRQHDSQYRIVALVQCCSKSEGLKTSYLAQLLNLSLDQPVNLYQFNTEQGVKNLLACPLVKEATIQKIRPGTLYIHYDVRTPVAYLGDYTNTAIDAEGYLFPFKPFYTPKKLPTFYLGLKGEWGKNLAHEPRFQLALELSRQLDSLDITQVKQVDVTDAFADSYGQRQIIVMLVEDGKNRFLRLNSEGYGQSLANYRRLRDELKQRNIESSTIDLRIAQLAFIK